METVSSNFNVLPFHEAIDRLQNKSLPPRALCITFDDGYADNFEVALPILQKFDLPATFFVATGFLDGGRMWNDSVIEAIRNVPDSMIDLSKLDLGKHEIRTIEQRQQVISKTLNSLKYLSAPQRLKQVESLLGTLNVEVPTNLMMTSEQVRGLVAAGMEVGAHTVNHPILASLDLKQAREEIENGKSELEDIIGIPVDSFAYPNGKPGKDYLADHVKMVQRAGYSRAVSTAWSVSTSESDIYQLPRFTPWDTTPFRFMLRMLQNLRQVDADIAQDD